MWFCSILTIGGMTLTVWQDKIFDFAAEHSKLSIVPHGQPTG